MKRSSILFLALLLVVGCARTHPLVGNWSTVDQTGKESLLFFRADQTFEALGNGEKLSGKWAWNEDAAPPLLELSFEQKKITTIAEIQGDQLLIEPREGQDEMPRQFTEKVQRYRRQ